MRVGYGTMYSSQQYRTRNDYFPRYPPSRAPELNRLSRTVGVESSPHRRHVDTEFVRPVRSFVADSSRDFHKGRSRGPEDGRDEGRRYTAPRDDSRPSHSHTGRGSPILSDTYSSSAERGNRYKYLNDGWFNTQKTQYATDSNTPQSDNLHDRDHLHSRDEYRGHTATRNANDRYRYEKGTESAGSTANLEQRSYINPEILMETRQLEERVAAIQRELDMLENDNTGSRSSDYRGSRNAHPQANLSGNLPSLLDFAAPADSVEKARLEREEVNLRIRERELLRREQELLLRQRRLRNRTPPRYGRVMPPRPPRNATFPKTRSLTDGIRRSTNFKRTFKPLKSLPTRLAEKRSTRRSTYVPKKAEKNHRNTAEREFKEVHSDISAKKSAEEEDLFKKLDHDDDVETLIDKVIGTDESYDPSPRSRAVVKLLEFCDKDLLMDEISGKVEALCTGSKPSDINDCTSTGYLRKWNPTVLGPLDQYVPLRSFEEEVKIDSSDEGLSSEVLKNLQSVLEVYSGSPFA